MSNGSRPGFWRRRRRIRIWVAVVAGIAVWSAALLVLHNQHAHAVSARVLCGCHGLNTASAIAVDGAHVWVVSDPGNGDGSVTELNASDGSWIRTLSGARYGFRHPSAIAAVGNHIWVANDPETGNGETPKVGDGTVTELNASDGSWVRTLSGGRYGFDFPSAIVADRTHVWVANSFSAGDGGSVTELNARSGSWIRTISGHGLTAPSAIIGDGAYLWVANSGGDNGDGGSVTELNESDGSLIWTVSGGRYGFNDPSDLVRDGVHIWVTNLYPAGNGGSVTELNARDGSWVQTLSGGCYDFQSPAGIAADGSHIWVANSYINQAGGSVTELNANDGSWARTMSNDSQLLTLQRGCTKDLLAGSYSFSNPALISAVGTHVWVLDGTFTMLSAR